MQPPAGSAPGAVAPAGMQTILVAIPTAAAAAGQTAVAGAAAPAAAAAVPAPAAAAAAVVELAAPAIPLKEQLVTAGKLLGRVMGLLKSQLLPILIIFGVKDLLAFVLHRVTQRLTNIAAEAALGINVAAVANPWWLYLDSAFMEANPMYQAVIAAFFVLCLPLNILLNTAAFSATTLICTSAGQNAPRAAARQPGATAGHGVPDSAAESAQALAALGIKTKETDLVGLAQARSIMSASSVESAASVDSAAVSPAVTAVADGKAADATATPPGAFSRIKADLSLAGHAPRKPPAAASGSGEAATASKDGALDLVALAAQGNGSSNGSSSNGSSSNGSSGNGSQAVASTASTDATATTSAPAAATTATTSDPKSAAAASSAASSSSGSGSSTSATAPAAAQPEKVGWLKQARNSFGQVGSVWPHVTPLLKRAWLVDMQFNLRSLPLQALCLLVLPVYWALPRLIRIQLALPAAVLEGRSGMDALDRSRQLTAGRVVAIGLPILVLIAMGRGLEWAQGMALMTFPARWWREVIEVPLAITALFSLAKIFVTRMQDMLPLAAYQLVTSELQPPVQALQPQLMLPAHATAAAAAPATAPAPAAPTPATVPVTTNVPAS